MTREGPPISSTTTTNPTSRLRRVIGRMVGGGRRAAELTALHASADELVEAGDGAAAVDLLTAAYRDDPDPTTAVHLVDVRRQAAAGTGSAAGPGDVAWPPAYADPFADQPVGVLPEIHARDLTVEAVGGGVAHHGCLVVRHLLDEAQVGDIVEIIHRIEPHRDVPKPQAAPDGCYRPIPGLKPDQKRERRMVAGQGGTWLADSPVGTVHVLDALAASGALRVVAEHFGERPYFSVQKSTLRRSPPINKLAGWHQDGSFLGPEVRSMNIWVALSSCGAGRPTPGLEVVPKRVDHLLPTDGGLGSASISDDAVAEVAGGIPLAYPGVEPGDALFFDERFVHRTHLVPDMTTDRYALECWLFAPTHAPRSYVPLLA